MPTSSRPTSSPGACCSTSRNSKRSRASAAFHGKIATVSACDYAETLKRWRERYDQAVARGALTGFEEPFHNLWRYYLMYCEGGFRGGAIDVAQVTMVKRWWGSRSGELCRPEKLGRAHPCSAQGQRCTEQFRSLELAPDAY